MAASNYFDTIQQVYTAFYQRPADPAGLYYWAQRVDVAGGDTSSVINAFATSEEAVRLYNTIDATTIGTVIDEVYLALFDRTPDEAGKQFYIDNFTAGTFTAGTIVLRILDGARNEDAVAIQNKLEAANLFTKTLDPEQDGIGPFTATYNADDEGAARTWLAGVTSDPLTRKTQSEVVADIQANIANAGDPILNQASGQTFTLTTSADTGSSFTGTSGNDTYQGAIVADNGTGTTFNAADNLSGAAGTDTLNVTVSGATTAAVAVGVTTLAGIEKVLVSNFDTGATDTWDHDFNTALWTGVTTLGLTSSAALGDTKFSNVAAIATAEMKAGAGDFEIDYAAAAVAGTADTQTLVLDAVSAGTFTADAAVETVAITAASTATASTLTDLVATGATKITIDSDVALTITNALDATAVTVDGSASAGALSLNFTAAAANLAVTGGTGNDTFTFDATGTLTTADTLVGGDGTDTLVNVSAQFEALDAAVMTTVTGFEALTISNAATAGETLTTASFGSISRVNLAAGTAGAYNVNFATGGGTVSLVGALGGTLTVAAAGTATTDAVTLAYGDATADSAAQDIATTAVETLTINNTKAADTTGAITMGAASTGGATTLVFTGDKTMTTGAITAATVNASALTSTAALVMGAASVGATSITGSANGDTLYGIAAAASTIDGGAGNDSIVGGSAADNVTAGAGNDTIVGAGGNDVITGGDGNDTITELVAGTANIDGGAGNDTITMTATISTADTLAGGDGTDTLSISAADITALNGFTFTQGGTFNTNMSGFEKVSISDAMLASSTATNILDMSRLDSVNHVVVTTDQTAITTQVQGIAAASTLEWTAAQNAAAVLIAVLGDATGSSDSITVKLNSAAGGAVDFGKSTIASVETITVNSTTTNATVSTAANTIDLTIANATSVTITGNASVDLSGAAINAAMIDASANTNAVKVLGSSANQTITGTVGADTIDGGAGADTISGGTGADTLTGGTGADSITGGEAADTIVGGAGNDSIVLTETTAAVDDVVISYSEAGTNVDSVVGFTTTATGDEIQLSLGALELAGTSGIHSATTNFQALNANTDAAAGAGTVQVMTTAAASAGAANIFVLSGATFSSLSEVEDAIETGGSYQIGVSATDADLAVADAFIVVWTDGTNAHVSSVRIATDPSTNGVFAAGGTVAADLVTLAGVSTIGATTFAAGNFEWIA